MDALCMVSGITVFCDRQRIKDGDQMLCTEPADWRLGEDDAPVNILEALRVSRLHVEVRQHIEYEGFSRIRKQVNATHGVGPPLGL
jgi:hypothetical protein